MEKQKMKSSTKSAKLPGHQISERFYNQHQSWFYDWTGALPSGTFRVSIRRNAYDEQSWIKGYCFNKTLTCWQLLVEIPIHDAKCSVASYARTAEIEHFQEDAKRAIEEMRQILE
jgi:hypothetical protein